MICSKLSIKEEIKSLLHIQDVQDDNVKTFDLLVILSKIFLQYFLSLKKYNEMIDIVTRNLIVKHDNSYIQYKYFKIISSKPPSIDY